MPALDPQRANSAMTSHGAAVAGGQHPNDSGNSNLGSMLVDSMLTNSLFYLRKRAADRTHGFESRWGFVPVFSGFGYSKSGCQSSCKRTEAARWRPLNAGFVLPPRRVGPGADRVYSGRRTDSQLTSQRQRGMSPAVVNAALGEREWAWGEPRRRPSAAGSQGAAERRRQARAPPRGALAVAIHPTGSGRPGRASW